MREIWAHKLTTSAVEQPIIRRPPIISPQRMLLCSMNAASTSEKGLRGALVVSVGISAAKGACAAAGSARGGGVKRDGGKCSSDDDAIDCWVIDGMAGAALRSEERRVGK